jgi:2-hydroxycyclohexanecarboxyl-CoA dehydrogenase
MSLKGKTAVVTGAARGIGRAIALRLARDGAAIAVWERDLKNAENTIATIREAGGKALLCECDVSSRDDIARCLAATHQAFGKITVLVNNAGIWSFTPFLEIDDDLWNRVFNVNMGGTYRCTQAILPDMLEAGWGRIINISSSSAQAGAVHMAHYAASKGAVIAFTKALAMELAQKGITVNNVPPGFVETEASHELTPLDFAAVSAVSPMRRPGKPEDIAAACSYLASPDAEYVTGQTISVNGGRYLV